ncbi:hypothetical protein [Verrucosispora sp. WMMD1129]|uniref:hypothetical protein n=1 Tax=Verrucosispora sp. WMMD1129 TaxID=3016093 RepID=UPI00249C4E9F|nr:hypothetical protein [Verrucosispora sp. WMMD1129]WFE44267.1 hypothetical protein O7624_07925 [Verrucosispora sp. WMMD1129]
MTDAAALALLTALLDGDFEAVYAITSRAHETDLILSLMELTMRMLVEISGTNDGAVLAAELRAALTDRVPGVLADQGGVG